MYLEKEAAAIEQAKDEYRAALAELQANCEHKVVLKHTDEYYKTHRVCEDCGLHESVQWDSDYRYQYKGLLGRAYDVSWKEYYSKRPVVV